MGPGRCVIFMAHPWMAGHSASFKAQTVSQVFGEMLRSGLWFYCSGLRGLRDWKQQVQLCQE